MAFLSSTLRKKKTELCVWDVGSFFSPPFFLSFHVKHAKSVRKTFSDLEFLASSEAATEILGRVSRERQSLGAIPRTANVLKSISGQEAYK